MWCMQTRSKLVMLMKHVYKLTLQCRMLVDTAFLDHSIHCICVFQVLNQKKRQKKCDKLQMHNAHSKAKVKIVYFFFA